MGCMVAHYVACFFAPLRCCVAIDASLLAGILRSCLHVINTTSTSPIPAHNDLIIGKNTSGGASVQMQSTTPDQRVELGRILQIGFQRLDLDMGRVSVRF